MILTFVEHDGRSPAPASLTALTLARDLDDIVTAVCFAPVDGAAVEDGHEPAEGEDWWSALRSALAGYGVASMCVVDEAGEYSPEMWGAALGQIITAQQPSIAVAAATDRGNEVMAQAAARADVPLAGNCVAVTADGEVTRARGGGILLEDATVTGEVALATVLPSAADPREADEPAAATVQRFVPDLDGMVASRIVETTTRGEGISLASAPIVVSGGRGVGSAEGFAPLEDLAALVGGAVGCSRVVTNNGWRPHSDQVGQTGTKVNPRLYIACGISGATQHWVGCMDSKAILAINTDPEAPMVTRATYAVIGDVQEVIPAVVEEVRKRHGT